VTPDQLKTALQQVREQAHNGDKGDFAQALASALNIDPATVEPAWQSAKDAFKARAKAQRDAWVAALASALSLPTEQVATALHSCGGANKFAHKH
jgi:acyl-CoA reductase-like NAD-dependent aldehyde dehydrogenase